MNRTGDVIEDPVTGERVVVRVAPRPPEANRWSPEVVSNRSGPAERVDVEP